MKNNCRKTCICQIFFVPLLMEMRNKFLKKLKTSFHFQISRRDLTISDVAFAQQNENKLSFAFAYSQHCTCKKVATFTAVSGWPMYSVA